MSGWRLLAARTEKLAARRRWPRDRLSSFCRMLNYYVCKWSLCGDVLHAFGAVARSITTTYLHFRCSRGLPRASAPGARELRGCGEKLRSGDSVSQPASQLVPARTQANGLPRAQPAALHLHPRHAQGHRSALSHVWHTRHHGAAVDHAGASPRPRAPALTPAAHPAESPATL